MSHYAAANLYVDCSEEAVEYDELSDYLRLNESYDPKVEEDRPLLPQQVIGVPGAASHAQMTPEHHKPAKFLSSDSPRGKPVNKRDDEFDVSAELEGYGLQGVKVTEDDLAALVQELGLGGDEADDLVRGLSTPAPASKKEDVKKADPQAALMAELSAKIKPAAKAPAEAEKPKPSEESVPTEPKPVEENVGTKSEETDTTETKPKEEAVFKKEETPEAPSSEKVEEVLSKATEEIKVAETKVAEETKQTEEAKKPEETKAAEELKETAEITKTEPDAKAAV